MADHQAAALVDNLLGLLLAAGIAAYVWWVTRPSYDFTIRAHGGEIQFAGKIAQVHRAQVAEFLRRTLATGQAVKISGRRRRDGRLTLKFTGRLDAAQRQQIRNYLVEVL